MRSPLCCLFQSLTLILTTAGWVDARGELCRLVLWRVGGRQMWLISLSRARGSFCWAKFSHLRDYVPRLVEILRRVGGGQELMQQRKGGMGGRNRQSDGVFSWRYSCWGIARSVSIRGVMYVLVSWGRWWSERQKRKDLRVGGVLERWGRESIVWGGLSELWWGALALNGYQQISSPAVPTPEPSAAPL